MLKPLVLVIFLSIIGQQQTAAVDVITEETGRSLRSIKDEGIKENKGPQKRSIVSFLSSEKLTPGLLKSDVIIPFLNHSQISGRSGRNHVLENKPNGLGDFFCEGDDCTGYMLEFTRTNTDCSGRVEGIGGLLLGHPTFVKMDGEILTTMFLGGANENSYGYNLLLTNDLDFEDFDSPFQGGNQRCSSRPDSCGGENCYEIPDGSGFIPYSTELYDHGGYFYGHKFVPGFFPAVLRQIGGAFYDLYFDTLDHCLTGERPFAFFAHLKKGECYFDPTNFGIDGIDEHTGKPYQVHSWFKVVGFDSKEQEMIFTIHNNNDCDQFSFGTSKKRTVSFLNISPRKFGFTEDPVDGMEPVYGDCQPFSRGPVDFPPMRRLSNSNLKTLDGPSDGPLGRMWVKRTAA